MMDDERVKVIPTPAWFAEKGKAADKIALEEDIQKAYASFREKYAPDKWENLTGDDLLSFFSIGYKPNSLCYALEYDHAYDVFGAYSGGSSWHYGVYRKDGKQWKTSLKGKTPLKNGVRNTDSDEAAELLAKIRSVIFQGFNIIKDFGELQKISDYKKLENQLTELNRVLDKDGSSNFITRAWVLKYYHMFFPNIFPCWYSTEWINYIIKTLDLPERKDYFEKIGEIMLYVKKSNLSVALFSEVFDDQFGKPDTEKWPEDLYEGAVIITEKPADVLKDNVHKLIYAPLKTSIFLKNRIIFGAPGTGKSFFLKEEKEKLLGKNNEADYERVTFHPEYSYANFVGTYKPVMIKNADGKKEISYAYVPGPFMRILVKALKSAMAGEEKPFLLLIEEINRANVAGVFGDVFQLLDRNKDDVSEFPIATSEDMRAYLAEELGVEESVVESIRIPNNMFIWATMNSADQGVYPMDTAFKRRWDFEYLSIDEKQDAIADLQFKHLASGQTYAWNDLRKAINDALINMNVNEDKLLGPFFLQKSAFDTDEKFAAAFKSKVLMYLFEDAARQRRSQLFIGCGKDCNIFSRVCQQFDEIGLGIFGSDFLSKVPVLATEAQEAKEEQ